MVSKLYDIDASKARIAELKSHIAAQRQYIGALPLEGRQSAQERLETLKSMLEISEKTDFLIGQVVASRDNDGLEAVITPPP